MYITWKYVAFEYKYTDKMIKYEKNIYDEI
jgi:hypothetical protein